MVRVRRADLNLRHEGLRLAREGDIAASSGDRENARQLYRRAIADLVEAFLEDREGNGNLFVVAHRVGEALENIGGCVWEIDEARRMASNTCPIEALHSRIGASIAMVTRSVCSICDAGDLQCDHIPGETYGGNQCFRKVTEVLDLDHLALTQNPDFTFTFQTTPLIPLREIGEHLGELWEPGKSIYSHHCQQCYGRLEYRPDDVDRRLWPKPGGPDEPAGEDDSSWAAPGSRDGS